MQEQETVVRTEAKATLKYARISSRKVKIVADLIRGKAVDEALAIVKFTPKASSEIIEKLLKSAMANAENNHDILKKCDVLNQYSKFVQVYESNKGSSERMEQTIKYCIRHNILSDYIKRKGKEVISMLTAEWNMEEALEVAREEGEISGQRKNEEKMVINLYKAGGKLELIATAAEKSVEEIKQILNRSGVIPE